MPRANALLASLSSSDAAALQPHLRRVELQQKSVLYNAGDPVNAVYFPTSAVQILCKHFHGEVRGSSSRKL